MPLLNHFTQLSWSCFTSNT